MQKHWNASEQELFQVCLYEIMNLQVGIKPQRGFFTFMSKIVESRQGKHCWKHYDRLIFKKNISVKDYLFERMKKHRNCLKEHFSNLYDQYEEKITQKFKKSEITSKLLLVRSNIKSLQQEFSITFQKRKNVYKQQLKHISATAESDHNYQSQQIFQRQQSQQSYGIGMFFDQNYNYQ